MSLSSCPCPLRVGPLIFDSQSKRSGPELFAPTLQERFRVYGESLNVAFLCGVGGLPSSGRLYRRSRRQKA
ncbi:hypothetical protein TNIN_204991 [Trichonephila inaurata madagascariensis]|uniref:Uncharacterized protein n=1 Tax=Trichonephila inaurata madagascariensis TaxID=2747483 RepID=A0A8X7CPD9_9ARAC|nr:hypothetical protein TNIN_204991 [Trichonephila inaurata madagascariensis]